MTDFSFSGRHSGCVAYHALPTHRVFACLSTDFLWAAYLGTYPACLWIGLALLLAIFLVSLLTGPACLCWIVLVYRLCPVDLGTRFVPL